MIPNDNPTLGHENIEYNSGNTPGEDETLAKGEITNNDGSIVETLDTAFHGKPGFSEGQNISGSNRAGYYEERSEGKTEAEQELDGAKD